MLSPGKLGSRTRKTGQWPCAQAMSHRHGATLALAGAWGWTDRAAGRIHGL